MKFSRTSPSRPSMIGAVVIGLLMVATLFGVYNGFVVTLASLFGSRVEAPKIDQGDWLRRAAPEHAPVSASPSASLALTQERSRDAPTARSYDPAAGSEPHPAEVAPPELAPSGQDARNRSNRPWRAPSPEELFAMAKECRVRGDWPTALLTSESADISAPEGMELGLRADEVGGYNRAMRATRDAFRDELRKLYAEIVGDTVGGDAPTADVLVGQIEEAIQFFERSRAQQRLAQERAGLIPPADPTTLSPIERYVRMRLDLGDASERALAVQLGTERARALRDNDRVFGVREELSGCPED